MPAADPRICFFRLRRSFGLGLECWLGGNAAHEIVIELKK
jgi:hypothetical protein